MLGDLQQMNKHMLQVAPFEFGAIAQEASQAEVSRLFSAMLQLINNGNIHILPGHASDDPFQIKLQNVDRPHQQFSEYRAPSVQPEKVMYTNLCSTLSVAGLDVT